MKNWPLKRPFIETDGVWATVATDRDLMKASWIAVKDMIDYVTMKFGITEEEALLLLSASGNVRVCQIVNKLPTTRFEVPKRIIRNR